MFFPSGKAIKSRWFVYLGPSVAVSGGSDTDIRRRIEVARSCMKALDRGVRRSSISLPTHETPAIQYNAFLCYYLVQTHSRNDETTPRIL